MKTTRRIVLGILLACLASLARGEVPILPFAEVRAGMKGTGRTVFNGTVIETFDVEILGTLPKIGPSQDLILARCSGGPLATTGILAGMSGSPVFVEGKLVGAVAYAWGFSKEPIAGITPIAEMLAVTRREASPGRVSRTGGGVRSVDLHRLRSHEALVSFLTSELPARIARPAGAFPGAVVPVSVSGIGAAGVDRISPELRQVGLLPAQGGGAGASPAPAGKLEPGSAVGLKLVRGDVDMTATGTVTWAEANRVLAFGHPLFGLGTVGFPLTGARVEALLPSLDRSLRLAIPLAEVGAIVEDRSAGVLGRLGVVPPMIPVRLRISGGAKEQERTFSFDVADDPLLAPLLLYNSLNGILASLERVYGSVTLRLEEGSVIKVEGQSDVDLRNLFAGSTAPYFATGTSAFILYLLMNNDLTPPRIEGVNLIVGYDDEPRTARLRRVTLDRYRVRAGEDVEATIVLSPFRGPNQVFTRRVPIPEETPPGPIVLNVGDAFAVSRTEIGDAPLLPTDLSQLVALINRVPRNDRVYIVASREDSGVFLGGVRLPNLPPSAQTVLTRPRSRGNFSLLPQRSLVEEEIPVDYAVEGLARVQLEVELP